MPPSFSRRDIFRPTLSELLYLVRCPPPRVIRDSIIHYFPLDLALTPEEVFGSFVQRRVPAFILNFFMYDCQPEATRRTTVNSRTHRAIHLILAYRSDLQLFGDGAAGSENAVRHLSLPPVMPSLPLLSHMSLRQASPSFLPNPTSQELYLANLNLVRSSSTGCNTDEPPSSPLTRTSQPSPDVEKGSSK